MALLTIRIVPAPVLRRRAREVKLVDDSVRKLAKDMIETMQHARGVGLAANQVGVLKRLIVLQMPDEDPRVMINPEITAREGQRDLDEGCLSLPGFMGIVTRSVSIKARALDEHGARLRLTADELLAQAIEHEVDHLNGILYFDHLAEHEQVRRAAPPARGGDGEEGAAAPPPVDPSTPHHHDVQYELHISHMDDASPPGARKPDEILSARAELSGLTSDASVGDLVFDVTALRLSPEELAHRTGTVRRRSRATGPSHPQGVPPPYPPAERPGPKP